jgi:hypothetical protein
MTTVLDKIVKKRKKDEQDVEEKIEKMFFEKNFPYIWKFTDLDIPFNFALLVFLRILMALLFTQTYMHADEYWQVT